MGNKLCKKKTDAMDNSAKKSPASPFNRIFNRLHLRPNAWKSDSQLHQKQANRCDVDSTNDKENIIRTQPLSKSSDWTDVDLEVPEKEEHVHLPNPKLTIIFNRDSSATPIPPPRKNKKNFREKIEAVAKSGLQAFQSKKPVEEPRCVKKIINYKCPGCDADEKDHNRNHHHNHGLNDVNKENKEERKGSTKVDKDNKRRKNLSVISLPNYDELKLTVAYFDDIDKDPIHAKPGKEKRTSDVSLPGDPKKHRAGSMGKLDTYITRCRSIGSLLPHHLKKLRPHKVPADVESDDSFGGLEDWDLGLIEHYNPKDASLPRPRKIQKDNADVLSDIESLVVTEEEIEKEKPKPPIRRSESLVKKINKETVQVARDRSTDNQSSKIATPPPSPLPAKNEKLLLPDLPTQENGTVEHSSLMKILEKFSIQDKQNPNNRIDENNVKNIDSSNESSLTPSLLEFEKNIAVNSVEEFINAEKLNTDNNFNIDKFNKSTIS